jgi:hypothetical protein
LASEKVLFDEKKSENEDESEEEIFIISSQQKWMLLVFILSMAISQTTRQNAVALFPAYVGEHHESFSSLMVGVLLCAY